MTTIDAKNLILGRLASNVAKRALMGESIDIVNCEDAIISGNKYQIFDTYYQKRSRGTFKGPIISKLPSNLVRRTIRGMLPYKKPHGREAFERIKCHIGTPAALKEKAKTIKEADVEKIPNYKYTTIGKVCKNLGWTE